MKGCSRIGNLGYNTKFSNTLRVGDRGITKLKVLSSKPPNYSLGIPKNGGYNQT
jgi:hypothetical protein